MLAVCGGVALAGAIVTFFFTPVYTPETLDALQRRLGMVQLPDVPPALDDDDEQAAAFGSSHRSSAVSPAVGP